MHTLLRQLGFIGVRRPLYSSNNPLATGASTNPIAPILTLAKFYLPFQDLGSGAVSTTLSSGAGPATFTRATTAWTKLSTGLWASVASGTARSTYLGASTAVGAYAGYLAEGAGTQLVTPTASIRDMTDASWIAVTMTAAKTSTGIDGAANSCTRLTATGASATILQTLVAAASNRTYSAFVKRITGSGTINIQCGAQSVDITALINGATFTRVSVTDTDLNAAFGFTISTNGDAIDVDFNQFEAGSFPTSPMDAAGAVRNADVLTYSFAGSGASAINGTCAAELTLQSTSTGAVQAAVSTGTATAMLNIASAAAATSIQISDGTNNIAVAGLTDMSTAVRKRAASWGGAIINITGDGVAITSGAFDGDIGSTSIGIGCATDGTLNWFGTIKNVRIWTQAFRDQQLQALTS